MNPIFKAASEALTAGAVMAWMTAFFVVFFGGWVIWAYWPANRSRLEEAGRLPLDDDFTNGRSS
jgi:cbb3-type cytochrome oxidase subunit 3